MLLGDDDVVVSQQHEWAHHTQNCSIILACSIGFQPSGTFIFTYVVLVIVIVVVGIVKCAVAPPQLPEHKPDKLLFLWGHFTIWGHFWGDSLFWCVPI